MRHSKDLRRSPRGSFQSTHPRGVRHSRILQVQIESPVSIHAPARGATALIIIDEAHHMFQSTHPRGVRRRLALEFGPRKLFQSTHPRGVRLEMLVSDKGICCFNPRTREGCDVQLSPSSSLTWGFNPRTREGCDHSRFCGYLNFAVSIHAPARGATPRLEVEIKGHGVSIHAPARGATSK